VQENIFFYPHTKMHFLSTFVYSPLGFFDDLLFQHQICAPGVNFINVKRTNFLYETSFFGSFSSYVSALAPKFCTKNARVNVDEIDTRELFLSSFRIVSAKKVVFK